MPGPAEQEKADHLERKGDRLRRRAAELASAVAATEEQVADTFEEVARRRPPPDAERLRAETAHARRYAAKERDRTAQYQADSGDDDPGLRLPAGRRTVAAASYHGPFG
jgi:hypothetical protein